VGLIASAAMPRARTIPINDLARLMKDGQIASVEVNGNAATATTRQHETFDFHVDQHGSLPQLLGSFGVTSEQLSQVSYSISSPSQLGAFANVAGALLPVVLFGGVALFILRRRPNGGEMLSFGKTNARVLDGSRPRITFEDVAGVDEAKRELQEVVEFLKTPD